MIVTMMVVTMMVVIVVIVSMIVTMIVIVVVMIVVMIMGVVVGGAAMPVMIMLLAHRSPRLTPRASWGHTSSARRWSPCYGGGQH
jgi:hypothetical protein